MDRALDASLVERFRADLQRVWYGHGTIGLAVSGGPDSLALLLLAQATIPGRIEAATVDHGLRAESKQEAEFVAGLCRELGVPHTILPVEVGSGNLQDRARAARYRALGGWAEAREIELVATAHQMDDQAETLIMRLNRGSGVHGLSCIRERTGNPEHDGGIIRPLLGWRRSELAELVERAGIEAVEDPSNSDEHYDRIRIRKALAGADWLNLAGLARSAELLGHASDAIDFAVGREWIECVTESEGSIRYAALRTGLARRSPVRTGVLESIARRLGGTLNAAGAAQMMDSLIAGQPCNIGGIAARAVDESGERFWLFAAENPRRTG